jgi:hypothetical protein
LILSQISGYSIFLAVLFSVIFIRFRNRTFFPFLLMLWIGMLNELISYSLIFKGHGSAINNNLYVLAESLLILWQFRRWGLFTRANHYYTFCALYLAGWLVENLFFGKIFSVSSFFQIGYSFITVLMSIQMINQEIVSEKKSLLKNAVVLICFGFVIYFTYKVFVEIFWMYGLRESKDFRSKVYLIMVYINLFVNLIYALAVLWMPRKPQFIVRS